MLTQYSPAGMAPLFSDRARVARWWEVELAALDAQEALGHAPPGTTAAARAHVPSIDQRLLGDIAQRRTVTGHEVAAFVDVIGDRLGRDAQWLHFGLTSADIIDTANGLLLVRALDVLAERARALAAVIVARADEHRHTPIMGRTHGMFAEPTTVGAKLAIWVSRVERDRRRLEAAREVVGVANMSGPVGNYSNVDPRVEQHACAVLGLARAVNAQFVSRDRYAEYVWACANIATTIEAIATQVRLLHASEVAEVHETFRDGQKGSSSMPHKKNPSVSMELCGLARVVRGYLTTSMESTVIWQEGDTASLAVERIVLPDVSNLTCFSLEQASRLVDALELDPVAMQEKFDAAAGLPFSSSLMHELIEAGLERKVAYRVMQRCAAAARREHLTLQEAFAREDLGELEAERISTAFSLERALRHVGEVTDSVTGRDDLGPARSPGAVPGST